MNNSSPLMNALYTEAQNYIGNLVNQGQLDRYQGQSILDQLPNHIPSIADQLARDYPGSVPVPTMRQSIAQFCNQMIQQGANQNNYQPFGHTPNYGRQVFSNQYGGQPVVNKINFGGGGNTYGNRNTGMNTNTGMHNTSSPSYDLNKPAPGSNTYTEPEPVPKPKGNKPVLSASTVHSYSYIENTNPTSYSTKCQSGDITSVLSLTTIQCDDGEEFLSSEVSCAINEPSVQRVIDNFGDTNPRLCKGKFMATLYYSTFKMFNFEARNCKAIDLSPMDNVDAELPVSNIIADVVRSIHERDFCIVHALEGLIVDNFNDRCKRYLRSSENINKTIKVQVLKDIISLATMQRADLDIILNHPKFQDTLLSCFKEAVKSVITDHTKLGYYDAKDIAPDLLTSPDFVIRENGCCEREMDIENEKFMQCVRNKYTAFANNGCITIANFIPHELDEDLDGNILAIEDYTNIFDSLCNKTLKNECVTILARADSRKLFIKVGKTLEGQMIMYSEPVDLV